MKLKFSRQTKHVQVLREGVHAHQSEIDANHAIALDFGARTGFVRKSARIIIGEDADTFETDWKWAANTFPVPLKILAHTLRIEGMVGTFAATYHDGRLTIQKVEPRRTWSP